MILVVADGITDICPEYRSSFEERVRRLSDVAGRSSAVIYALQTNPFSSGVRMPESRARGSDVTGSVTTSRVSNDVSERMHTLAEPTGGYARRSNDIGELIRSAFRDQEGYYVLGYEPPPGTFDGKLRYRKLQVRVSRRDAIVRSRAGFYNVDDASLFPK
jgi:VWFA-related protein